MADHHPFASSEPVGFQYIGWLQGMDKCQPFFQIRYIEGFICCSGYSIPDHELLCKVFAAFKPCSICKRAYHRYFVKGGIGKEKVMNSFHQRIFRAHNKHVNTFFQNKLPYTGKIIYRERNILPAK